MNTVPSEEQSLNPLLQAKAEPNSAATGEISATKDFTRRVTPIEVFLCFLNTKANL